MAYARYGRKRRASSSYSTRKNYGGARKRRSSGGNRRRAPQRRSGSGRRSPQTVRVVIEHVQQSEVGRPQALVPTAVKSEPKKKTF